jgi:DNA-nicking Smr family endonuclease
MAGKKDKSKKTPKLTRKDAELWKQVTKDVERLPERDYEEFIDEIQDKKPSAPVTVRERVSVRPEKPVKKTPTGKDVDGATARKFTRGKMDIEATVDLHGLGQSEAREVLRRFITASHQRGRRCVLVITGKGLLGKPGVLKGRVPEWLDEMGPVVLKTASAQPRHGGQGALYVLLRRQRD